MIEGCEFQEDDEFPKYEEEIVIGDSDEEEGLALYEEDIVSTKTERARGLVDEQHFSHHLQYWWRDLQFGY